MRIRIKEPHRLPSVMDMQEVVRIFRASYKRKRAITNESSYQYLESVRDIAVLELLFTTGARVSEIANLRKEAINLHSGSLTIRGKGNKERIIQICNKETICLLQHYYSLVEDRSKAAGGWFLINRLNTKLSDQSIRNMVKAMAKSAGIAKRVTPHVFRHSFATLLLV